MVMKICCRAARRANLQKSDSILSRSHFFLDIAAAKKEKVELNLANIKKREVRGKVLVLLQQCLERGDLTQDEVATILQQHSEQPESIFELIEEMQFADGNEVKFIAKADIESLWDQPIYIDGLSFENEKDEQIFVRDVQGI